MFLLYWRFYYVLLVGMDDIDLFLFAENEKGIFDAILEGVIDFDSQPWPSISNGAKDLVRRMLTQDPRRRITSAQVLGIVLYASFIECHSKFLHAFAPS